MYAQTEQKPAVTVFLVKRNSYSLIVVISDIKFFMLSGILIEVGYNFFAIFAEILFGNFYSELFAFNRFFEVSYNIIKGFAFISELNGFYNNFCNEVSTVIKEIVFFHSGMTRCFDSKRTVDIVVVLSYSLIYDVFVTSFKAEMFAFEVFFDKFFQAA